MITNEQLLEAIADAIRVRRRTPQAIFPHPFECSLIKVNTEELTLDLELMDGPHYKMLFTFKLVEKEKD